MEMGEGNSAVKGSDRQMDFWNSVAGSKGFHHPLNIELFRRLVPTDSRVVELGCGWGRVLGLLADSGYQNLHGFDPSPAMIERGKAERPALDLRVWSERQVPLEEQSADAVLLFAVLTCAPGDEDQRELIAEARRLLRPGGVLYISDYFLQADKRNLERYRRWQPVHGTYGVFEIDSGAVLRHMDRQWFESLTEEFEPAHFQEIDLLTMNGNPARAFQYLGHRRG